MAHVRKFCSGVSSRLYSSHALFMKQRKKAHQCCLLVLLLADVLTVRKHGAGRKVARFLMQGASSIVTSSAVVALRGFGGSLQGYLDDTVFVFTSVFVQTKQ